MTEREQVLIQQISVEECPVSMRTDSETWTKWMCERTGVPRLELRDYANRIAMYRAMRADATVTRVLLPMVAYVLGIPKFVVEEDV